MMRHARAVALLLLLLPPALALPGCASPGRRAVEGPRDATDAMLDDWDHATLERELSLYSD